ncbi:DUF4407 domain-containing protein [Olivibacter domesticus]|uniref:DUF4407 domain-containing protein n=1 Tax=Olivibacter domesticus TaxID=407022 RepID=A0A1H7S1V8_OLID1|nr:DUF4407 domain-containing protein [Olivibacter domesticus]SEL66445.1 protein of unknown function [Olivibacter domesticus]
MKINKFFWFCSGVHIPTLLKSPSEYSKYFGIGATIFFTGLFAALAGAYAMYFVFSGNTFAIFTSAIFGLIWGLAIFNMDRYIVSSINKDTSPTKQFLQATPRIALAILIGIVISRPLELKIFDKEISEQLKANYLQLQRSKIDTLNVTFDHKYKIELDKLYLLRKESDSLQNRLKADRQKLNYEIFGEKTTETSGMMGYGPYAKRKEEDLDNREQHFNRLQQRIDAQERFISERKKIDGLFDERLVTGKELDSLVKLAGFADRNAALEQLKYLENGKVNPSTYWAINFIGLLFIFFECLPVFVKLMSRQGAYDLLIKDQEDVIIYQSDRDKQAEMSASDQVYEKNIQLRAQRLQNEMELNKALF